VLAARRRQAVVGAPSTKGSRLTSPARPQRRPSGQSRRAIGIGKPLHSTERAKQVTVHYRWHPLYGQIARVRRTVPRSTSEVLFCELPDGATGALPAWMTDAVACAALTVGAPVVSIAALQELRALLDAVAPRAPDPTHASMPSKEGCDATNESVDPHPDPAVLPCRRRRAPD
jgi:hypothetical protein